MPVLREFLKVPNRRSFLHCAAWGLSGALARGEHSHSLGIAHQRLDDDTLLDVGALPKYVDALTIPRKAKPLEPMPGTRHSAQAEVHYRIAMREFTARVHRDVPLTKIWGYDGSCPGPVIEARSGTAVSVEWINELPSQHLFPIDHTLHGAEADKPLVRTAVHLHGGRVGPASDGYPENWITPGNSQVCFYPNNQEATALFYHDHAMGITRLNTAAGLMGLYLIRDELEDELNLPKGLNEIPLVLMDRSFRKDGQIYYPVSGDPKSPWVSEYYGAGILANGKLFPYLDVKPCKYRFRFLNSSNGSFYVLALAQDTAFASPNQPFFQIGSDQGFLARPQSIDSVILGPGERLDLVVDFSAHAGRNLYLRTKVAMIMQFRVASGTVRDSSSVPQSLRQTPRIAESDVVRTRAMTIADYQDRLGRSHVMLLNGCHWSMPVTEKPVLNSVEIWSFINLTDDSHPIHLNLGALPDPRSATV